MAEKEVQLAEKPRAGGRMLPILGVSLISLLVGGGAAAYFAGMLGGHGGPGAHAGAPVVAPRAEALYVPIDPAFTVNLQGGGPVRYLQTTVEVLTRNPDVEAQIKRHLPVIRSNLVMLFSSKESRALATAEGKEQLRAEALASIQRVLEAETGQTGAEEVYFTSFVMQ